MKKVLIVLAAVLFVMPASADEGMWLLPYLARLNMKDMKAKGLKLKAEDIYNLNGNSLKDAVVIFGGGCTGEIVSPEGLLLTNHHCGYGTIQQLSSVENDYLERGFWAMSKVEEIPAPGLKVQFIRRMEDVTESVIGRTGMLGNGPERDSVINANLDAVTRAYRESHPDYNVSVREFMGGNQYFAIMSEIYTDVRLVGTPPNSMGKFGGDTDNWMWPRHTADFSMFRIYAGPDNRPSDYSPDNKPYKAPVHLKISLKGVKENDFSMIMGFPGSTQRYMTTYEMQQMTDVENTDRIYVRGERQKILMEDMLADSGVRLKYAAKYASSSNYWKNAIGMNKALVDNKIPEMKALIEQRFQAWADGIDSPEQYRLALPNIRKAVRASSEADGVFNYMYEALLRGVEILRASNTMKIMNVEEGVVVNKEDVMESAHTSFYKDFNEPTDRRVAKRMFTIIRQDIPAGYLPSFYATVDSLYDGNTDAFVDNLYDNSLFSSEDRLAAFLDNFDQEILDNDPALIVEKSVVAAIRRVVNDGNLVELQSEIRDWHRVYVKGLTAMDPSAKYYPDANFTMRLTYGSVLPYEPRDGVTYKYYTTLRGVVEKEDPSNPLEFTVPDKLKTTYATSDYGRYGQDGELRLNFLTNNDITGGNSGSPVLNARGELIGLAFDGNWEAMSGDVVFEPGLQRCINVDIRYVLWTIDQFAGAGHLLNEMTIIE